MSGAIDKDLALELAHAEIKRLRTRQGSGGRQPALPGVSDELRMQATQAIVQMRNAAHSLKVRAPSIARELEERAEKMARAL